MKYHAATPLLLLQFSIDDGGGISAGDTDQWSWGTTPAAPSKKSAVWGTVLTGNHLNDSVDWVEFELPDLAKAKEPVVVISQWYNLIDGDYCTIEILDGGKWLVATPVFGYPEKLGYSGDSGGWVDDYLELSSYVDPSALRFVLSADTKLAGLGCYLSELAVYDDELIPPQIDPIVVPVDNQDFSGSYRVEVSVQDVSPVKEVTLYYRVNEGSEIAISAANDKGENWWVDIPAQSPDSIVDWYVIASDGDDEGRWPASGYDSFRIFLAAPTDLAGPDGRIIDDEVALSWEIPTSPHAVTGYNVYQDDILIYQADTPMTEATVEVLAYEPTTFEVSAQYHSLEGDLSDWLDLDMEVPKIDAVVPSSGYQGDLIYLEVVGAGLYLTEGQTNLEFDAGVWVQSVDVLDINAVRALVEIDSSATIGVEGLTISGPYGSVYMEEAFAINSSSQAPSVTSVVPDSIVQGTSEVVTVTANAEFSSPALLEVTEGFSVVGDVTVDGNSVSFTLEAENSAPPGIRLLILDDSSRIWSFDIEIEEAVYISESSCSTNHRGLKSMLWLPLLWVITLLRRERSHPL